MTFKSESAQLATPTQRESSIRMSRLLLVVGILFVVGVVAAGAGFYSRHRENHALVESQASFSLPTVQLQMPETTAPTQEIVLPGNMEALVNAPIYARTDGYVRAWYHDIGAHVRKGELLAEIETPELDEQLEQARADLATAIAQSKLARVTSERYQDLIGTRAVSQQDTDNAASNLAASTTRVASAQANVHRLEELQAFERVYAPFDGIITARNTDIGQLIQANGGTSTGPQVGADTPTGSDRALFQISNIQKLRVFVRVPQVYSPAAQPGIEATITLPQYPDQAFSGKLVRTSNAFDPATKTLLVEIDVENTTGKLLPGAYTEVHLRNGNSLQVKTIPVSALIFREAGLEVATVDAANRVHLVPVVPGIDFGKTIQILSGLDAKTPIITSPPDSLIEGERVRPVQGVSTSASIRSSTKGSRP